MDIKPNQLTHSKNDIQIHINCTSLHSYFNLHEYFN